MEIDHDRIDGAVLALMWLTLHDGDRASKGFAWATLDRLHRKGLIEVPSTGRSRSCSPKKGCRAPRTCSRPASPARPELSEGRWPDPLHVRAPPLAVDREVMAEFRRKG